MGLISKLSLVEELYNKELAALKGTTKTETKQTISNGDRIISVQTKPVTNEITDILKKYREELAGINWDEQNRQIDGTNERVELAGDTLKNLYLAGVKETSAAG